jgi:hypothetical protein
MIANRSSDPKGDEGSEEEVGEQDAPDQNHDSRCVDHV